MTNFFDESTSKSDDDDDIICDVRSERELALVICFLFEEELVVTEVALAAGSKLTKLDSLFSKLVTLVAENDDE